MVLDANLFPWRARAKRRRICFITLGVLLAFLLNTALVCFLFFEIQSSTHQTNLNVKKILVALSKFKPHKKSFLSRQKINSANALIKKNSERQKMIVTLLSQLGHLIPNYSHLSLLSVHKNKVQIQGNALQYKAVRLLTHRLKATHYLKKITLKQLSWNKQVKFIIDAEWVG